MKFFMKTALLAMLLQFSSSAKVLISIDEAIHNSFPKHKIEIEKKNILLNLQEMKIIQKDTKLKLHSRIVKTYFVKSEKKTIAYGVLTSRKIRSKNGVVLYLLDKNGKMLSIEIIAFNEPLEYLPNEAWKKQFENVEQNIDLELGQNITPITGATLSAKSALEGARIAQALYRTKLKEMR